MGFGAVEVSKQMLPPPLTFFVLTPLFFLVS
jgi:hypothetical protein